MNERNSGIIRDTDVRQLKPYVTEWISQAITRAQFGTATTGATGGTSGGSDFSEADALVLFYTKAQTDAWRTSHVSNESAHHPRNHPFLGTDHSYPASVEGEVVHDTGTGLAIQALDHDYLTGVTANQHHNQVHAIDGSDHTYPNLSNYVFGFRTSAGVPAWWFTGTDHSLDGAAIGEIVRSTETGGVTFEWLKADNYVNTGEVRSDGHLYLEPNHAAGFDIVWPEEGDFVSANHVSQESGILLRSTNGLIDARTIQVKNLFAESFIVQQKRAENGAIVITPGVTQTTREFTIPPQGQNANLYVADYQGLPDFEVMATNDDVRIFFMSESDILQTPTLEQIKTGQDVGIPVGGTIFTDDFESYSLGTDTGIDWRETANGNSMALDDTLYSIANATSGSTQVLKNTGGTNNHVHYDSGGLGDNYRVTGKVYIPNAATGWGITLFSQYGSGGVDEYYRIRFYDGVYNIHLDNHGGVGNGTGTTTDAFVPTYGSWHNFKAEVEDTGSQTEIRFKMWVVGNSEPASWQINAVDNTVGRATSGTFGFWSYTGIWEVDDVNVESINVQAGSYASVIASPDPSSLSGEFEVISFVYEGTSSELNITGPTLTQMGNQTVDGYTHKTFYRRYTSNGGDGNWTATCTGNAYGALSYTMMRFSKVFDGTGQIIVNRLTTMSNGTQLISTQDVGLYEGFMNTVVIAQHNDTGQAAFTESPDIYTSRGGHSSGTAPTTHVHTYVPGAGVFSYPQTTWTVSPSRSASMIVFTLRPIAAISGGFAMGSAYGTVTGPIDPGDLESDEQCYTFTTKTNSLGQGETVGIDTTVLNYRDYDAANPAGIITLTTLDQTGAPYLRFAHREEYDTSLGYIPETMILQLGVLDGLATYGPGEIGLVARGSDGTYDGEFAITTDQMFMQNIPLTMYDILGQKFFEVDLDRGLTIYTEYQIGQDDKRSLTFRDELTDGTLFEVYPVLNDLSQPYRTMYMDFDSGTQPTTGLTVWYQRMIGSGAGLAQTWTLDLIRSNPSATASLQVKNTDVSEFNVFTDIMDVWGDIQVTNHSVYVDTSTSTGIDLYNYSGLPAVRLRGYSAAGDFIITVDATHDGILIRDMKNAQTIMGMRALDNPGESNEDSYAWFEGPVYSKAGAFFASTSNDAVDGTGRMNNVDHLWHDDGNNRWHFVSDAYYLQSGNSGVVGGTLFLKQGTSNTSLGGYGRVWIDSGGLLKYTNPSGVTVTIS